MRALHTNHHRYRFILLLAAIVFLSVAALTVSPLLHSAYAEPVVYLEADVTLGGEKLPSTILYTGSAYSFDFLLYQSDDASVWTKDTDSTRRSNFRLKYFDADRHAIDYAPTAPGTYFVRVVAEDTMNGYKNTDVNPLVISHGVSIGESRFSIVNENLSLFSSALDGVSSLVLDDAHLDYSSAVTSGAKVLLEGQALTYGSQYTLAVEYYNRGTSVFVPTSTCADVGTYRLVAKIAPSVNLSKTVAPSALTTDGSGNRLLYREFTVTRASLSLELNLDSMYFDNLSSVTLSDASKTKLSSVGSYETKVVAPSVEGGNSAVERVMASGNGAVSYTPSAVGSYLYRVRFTASSAAYGVESGDIVDIPFVVKAVPYTVTYLKNNSESDPLDYAIMNSGGGSIQLSPVFYDRAGNALTSVYTAGGERKFSVAYKTFNTVLNSWQDLSAGVYPSGAGRYRVLVTFSSYARVTSDYNIEAGTVITKEFQIITSGTLSVTAANGGVNYYTGSGLVPALLFFSQGADVRSAVEGKYSLSYYDKNGASIGSSAPSQIGSYFFELTFTTAVPSLGVSQHDVYRGEYLVRYRGLSVTYEEGAFSFADQVDGSPVALTLGTSYSVSYYKKTGATYRVHAGVPTEQGDYLAVATFSSALPVYNVKSGDMAAFTFSIAGSTAWGNVATASIDLTYDVGVKEPILSFYNGATPIELSELSEYQVSFFKFDSGTETYLPSGHPVLAGDYRCLVTFLKSDTAKGLVRGGFASSFFTVTPKEITVSYTLKTSSKDLVYDGINKEYSVLLSADTRPLELSFVEEYAPQATSPVYRTAPYAAAGDYYVRTTLSNDRFGSLKLVGARLAFTVQKLSVDVRFTVPLSYRAMYKGSSVSPSLTFKALNGRHVDAGYKTESQFSSLSIPLSISSAYYASSDGVNYLISAAPVKTGAYRHEVSTGNPSVVLTTTSSIGDDESTVTPSYIWETQANVIFSVIPAEVKTQVTFDSDLFYTASPKGVSSISFMAYNSATSSYSTNVSAFSGDYKILYFTSDYQGVVSGSGSETKPVEKSYYVARIVIVPNGSNDAYLTEERYTFMNGKTVLGADMDGAAIEEGSYVDFVFRIKDQTRIDVLFDMPVTFAFDGAPKTIGATFVNNFSTVPFVAGSDYAITYIPDGGSETSDAPSAVGSYRVKLKFLRDNTAYRVGAYLGEFAPQNELYISANDAISYSFEIFAPRLMTATLNPPASLYYDGAPKAFDPTFTVRAGDEDCLVMLTYDTHYRVFYYELSGGSYQAIDGAPTLPGSYAVEVVFLKNLYDYKIDANGVEVQILLSNLTSIPQANGVFADASTPRVAFEVKKAVLKVGGLSVNDKEFDGTNAAVFAGLPSLSVKVEGGAKLGELVKENGVFPYVFVGSMAGTFVSVLPAENLSIDVSSYYALSEGASDLYELEFDDFKATIKKSSVTISPVDITRDYNPFAVESVIDYAVDYSQETMTSLFPTLDQSSFLIGELSRQKGSTVGWYPISIGTLALNDAAAGTVSLEGETLALSDLFEIKLVTAGYRIRERMVTISVKAGQYKLYGEADPAILLDVSEGTLIYNDMIVGSPKREQGENAGIYRVSLSAVTIQNGAGDDVSANYHITLRTGTFEIRKRRITISPANQTAPYTQGFDRRAINVLDRDHSNRNATADFVTNPGVGDRITGLLSSEPTEDPIVFKITMGTLAVVNASGKNVTSNYDIEFNKNSTYTVEKVDIVVRMAENAVLTKYYGDANPIIAFTIEKSEKDKLGGLTLSSASSIGRVEGEDVGTYRVYVDNSAHSFIVIDSGVDVSAYFNFNVRGVTFGDTMFTILPRPITVTVENASFENTGRDVIPVLKYLNANGSRLSSIVLSTLKVKFAVPDMKFDAGENSVTPIVVGEVTEDPNFKITVAPGTITIIYLQNVVSATLVPKTDEIYKKNKFIFAGIMLYKSVNFYKLDTANGEQPDRRVEISLPLKPDSDIRGDGFVAVALYSSRNPRAFSLRQDGAMLIYKDDAAYYVAVAQPEEWFYIIWGVVCILAGVLIYYTVVLIKKLVEKKRAKDAAKGPMVRAARYAKNGKRAGFIAIAPPRPDGFAPQQNSETDDLFSDTNTMSEADSLSASSETKSDEDSLIDENTDDLFASSASEIEGEEPAAEEKPAEKPKAKGKGGTKMFFAPSALTDKKKGKKAPEPEEEEIPSTDDLFAEDSASAFAAASELAGESKDAKEPKKIEPKKGKDDKNKKDKDKKGGKKGKDDNKKGGAKKNAPKGFRPMAFTPTGAKSSGLNGGTRSFEDDLFFDDDLDINTESAALSPYNDSALSDDQISIPSSSSKTSSDSSSDDDLVIAKSSNFFQDDEEEKKDGEDSDLL